MKNNELNRYVRLGIYIVTLLGGALTVALGILEKDGEKIAQGTAMMTAGTLAASHISPPKHAREDGEEE